MNYYEVVIYLRESTIKQIEETEGIEIQRERIEEYCEKNNYKIIKTFSDEGVSGAKEIEERPALQEMLSYCKNPPIQYVIVDKPDRLSRDFINQLFIEKELLRSNVVVLFASNESTNISGADTEMDKMMKTAMRQMMGIFAEIERKMIVKRLTDGMKKKARGGNKAAGRLPFGYEYSDDKSKTTAVNQAQAQVIRKMFELRRDGLSTIKIADTLNKKRNTSDKHAYVGCNANRNPWNAETVRLALKNGFYIGKFTHAKEKIEGSYESIIDIELWNAVQGMDKRRKCDIITSKGDD